MTFSELQTAVLGSRFPQSSLTNAKNWINARYAWIWQAEDWSFKRATATVTTTLGAQLLTTGFPTAYDATYSLILDDDGWELTPYDSKRFHSEFNPSVGTGRPYAYLAEAGSVYVGPTPDAAYAMTLDYQVGFTALVNAADTPTIPSEFHDVIVSGAMALGLKRLNDPTWQALEQDFLNGIQVMRGACLDEDMSSGNAWPNDPSAYSGSWS